MSDEQLRRLERTDWRLGIRERARIGQPYVCIFCDHALTGEDRCSFRRHYVPGDTVRAPTGTVDASRQEWSYAGDGRVYVGYYLGDNKVAIQSHVSAQDEIRILTHSVIEMPTAWLPDPCGCDHTNVPVERTRFEYEEAHGVDKRICMTLRPGQELYHTDQRNSDGTPWRCRVNGKLKTWKRDPWHFRLPWKRGMYTYGAVDQINCHMFRTRPEWAFNKHERSQRGIA